VQYSTPFTIVHGWGDTNRGLIDKWGSRAGGALPFPPANPNCETCNATTYLNANGDAPREVLAASWLVQASKAGRLHASIANSVFTHHHTIGIVAGDTVVSTVDLTPTGATRTYEYSISESFDRVDVETGFSVTSLTENATDRRAAVHAIAATMDALEGSAAAQTEDLPDTVSTATRFEWGNLPPVAEDPSASTTTSIGARKFYDFNSANVHTADGTDSIVKGLLLVEGKLTTTSSDTHGVVPTIGQVETQARQGAVASLIYSYASLPGWDVIASEEAFLGPGQRAGA
jgi:hypothetical protein